MLIENEFKKCNGETIHLPKGVKLGIDETSNNVYQIDMFDSDGRNVSNHGTDLDGMVEKALEDLLNMKK